MAPKKSAPDWRRHELVTKAIFERLVRQDNPKNLRVKHNVARFKGISTSHQIDVLWIFEVGGSDYLTIFEVKKRKAKATKNDLIWFLGLLAYIPGQPKGIFVTESGFQKGARDVARMHDIGIFEIREVVRAKSDHLS